MRSSGQSCRAELKHARRLNFHSKKKKNEDFEEKEVRSASETSCVPWKLTRGTASTADATRAHSPCRAVSIALLGCRDRPPAQLLQSRSSKHRARRQAGREAGRVPLAIFIKLDAFWQNISIWVSQQLWKAAVGCSGAGARRVGERRRDTHLTRHTALGGSLAGGFLSHSSLLLVPQPPILAGGGPAELPQAVFR